MMKMRISLFLSILVFISFKESHCKRYLDEIQIEGELVRILQIRSIGLNSSILALENNHLAISLENNDIEIWNMTSEKRINNLKGHNHPRIQMKQLKDGSLVTTSIGDKSILIWNPYNGKLLHNLTDKTDRNRLDRFSYSFEELSNGMLVSGHHQLIKFWDVKNGGQVAMRIQTNEPHGLIYLKELTNDYLLRYDYKNFELWDLIAGRILLTFENAKNIDFAVSEKGFLASLDEKSQIFIYKINKSDFKLLNIINKHYLNKNHTYISGILAYSNDVLITWDLDRRIDYWNSITGEHIKSVYLEKSWIIRRVAVLSDSRLVAIDKYSNKTYKVKIFK